MLTECVTACSVELGRYKIISQRRPILISPDFGSIKSVSDCLHMTPLAISNNVGRKIGCVSVASRLLSWIVFSMHTLLPMNRKSYSRFCRATVKVKGKGAYSSSWNSPQNYGTPLVSGITQCYLPPDRGDRPAFTPTWQVGTRFIDPVRMKSWVGRLHTKMVYPFTDGHPSEY